MINTRFSVAVHIISLIASTPTEQHSSEWIAGSVNTNAVVIRRITGLLKRAGLVTTTPGVAGITLKKCPSDISLLEIYHAVILDDALFSVHQDTNPNCPVGRNIQSALNDTFYDAQQAMEQVLANKTVADVIANLK